MEKYGVVIDSGKTAEDKSKKIEVEYCPNCYRPLPDINKTGGIKICSQCGTKPFE